VQVFVLGVADEGRGDVDAVFAQHCEWVKEMKQGWEAIVLKKWNER
jgi:hypothetical protein